MVRENICPQYGETDRFCNSTCWARDGDTHGDAYSLWPTAEEREEDPQLALETWFAKIGKDNQEVVHGDDLISPLRLDTEWDEFLFRFSFLVDVEKMKWVRTLEICLGCE